MQIKTFAAIASVTLAVAGCAADGTIRGSGEAGSQIDEGGFGNPTMNNLIAQACNRHGKGVAGASAGKMGATGTADPVVVRDPSSMPARNVYRVYCDGNLNGEYAQVIYNEYISSAVPATVIEAGQEGAIAGGGGG